MELRSIAAFAPLLIVAAFYLIAPNLGAGGSASPFDVRRILECAALVLVLGCCNLPRVRGSAARTAVNLGGGASAGLGALLALGTAAAATSAFPADALLEVALTGGLVLGAIVVAGAASVDPQASARAMFLAAALSAAATVTWFAGNLVAASVAPSAWVDPHNPLGERLFSGFASVRFFGHWQTMTLLPVAALASRAHGAGVIVRTAVAFVAMAYWAMAFASGGRGTLLAVALGIAAVGVVDRQRTRGILGLHAGMALAGAAVYALWALLLGDALGTESGTIARTIAGGGSGRREAFTSAYEIIKSRPWLGVGPVHYAYEAGSHYGHPHNLLLRLASEWGLPAALTAAAIAARGLYVAVRSLERTGTPAGLEIRWTLCATVVAGAAHSMVSGLALMPLGQIGLMVTAGLLMADRSSDSTSRPTFLDPGLQRAGGVLAALCAAFAVALLLLATAPAANRLTDGPAQSAMEHARFRPRVWFSSAANYPIIRMPSAPTDVPLRDPA